MQPRRRKEYGQDIPCFRTNKALQILRIGWGIINLGLLLSIIQVRVENVKKIYLEHTAYSLSRR